MVKSNDLAPPLWRQLQATAAVIHAVRCGQSGTVAIEEVAASLRAGVQALSFTVLRHLGRAHALRQLLASRVPPAPVDALLCTALALLSTQDSAGYDAFTLVNQTVEAAKKTRSVQPQAAFMNACLRRFLREQPSLMAQTDHDDPARWNHPPWWIQRLQTDWPAHWQALLAANQQPGPMTLRINTRCISRTDYLAQLQLAGMTGVPVGRVGVALTIPVAVHALPGFAQGWVSVQDAAAQWAAPWLLGDQPTAGLRVLDACAAPGGKTALLL